MRAEYEKVTHPFNPVFSSESRVLILGSFPSVKSRENEFYYGHPRNRFWPMLAVIFGVEVPLTIVEKKKMIFGHSLALWDVIRSCDISGSSDGSIRNAEINDIPSLISQSRVERILCNGKMAYKLYERYAYPMTGIRAEAMPSTSPANAGISLDRLVEIWGEKIKVG